MNVSWMSNPQYLAQAAHVLGGASLILAAALLSNSRCTGLGPVWTTLAVGIAAASVKEFWFDIVYERDSWSDSLMDWTFYIVGGAVGVAIVELSNRLSLVCS